MRFDTEGFIRDITLAFKAEVREVLVRLYAEIVKNSPTSEIVSSVIMEVEDLGKEIIARAFPNHWTAIMHEWGSGSLLDPNNPDLAEYKASEYWNPARSDHYIRGRPKGYYKGIDDQIHYSGGAQEGEVLEGIHYRPIPPKHFVKRAVETIEPIFYQRLEEVLAKFPIERYVVV